MNIQHHRCSSLAVKGIFGNLLQGSLEGQDQFVSRLRILGFEDTHGFALNVDFNPALAIDPG